MERDNILLITTDQQRFDTINAWGNQSIFTPHLNYMAAVGISFLNCYADCPICVPSRTTIMTGRRGYESGVISNVSHEAVMRQDTQRGLTLPALLTKAGYQTCAKGKMHFQPARACYGFEQMRLPLDYMREYDGKKDSARPKVHGVGECEMEPVLSTVDTKDSITTWIADEIIDFLETRDPLRPFFLWGSFTKPHPPFDPCRDYWALYEGISMPEPVYGDWSEILEQTPQGFLAGCYENTNLHLFGKEQLQAVRRAYYAMITQVDYELGRILAVLREQKLDETTWIIFTSDHGEMLGDHHMSQKNLFFEGSAHVPLFIVPPAGRMAARTEKNLAEIADLYPTILHMAGVPVPDHAKGKSLLEPLGENRIFYGNSLDSHFCVMEDGAKLVYSARGDHTLLFDLKTDPMERKNLAEKPEWQEKKRQLWKLLVDHTGKTRPQVLEPADQEEPGSTEVNRRFKTIPAPRFPGDMPGRWFGFHCKDYSVDTFH